MKVLLYDVDSTIPNLALMKLSSHHKNNGDDVEIIRGFGKRININFSLYDKGYASVIFTKHKELVCGFPFEIGGVGYSCDINLPNQIEHSMPDYSLYPENEYSMGFATRGCIRNCSFCFVPGKEGLLKFNANLDEFYDSSLKKIMLLDNNIFAYAGYKKIFEQIRRINKPTCFKQGMDFRLLTQDKVEELLSIKYDREYIFAYDSMNIRSIIEKQMNRFRKNFKDWSLKFFVLVGFDTNLKEDVFRILYLKNNLCLPYVMRYENCYTSEYRDFYTDIAAWCNQVWAFKTYSFEQFLIKRYPKNGKRVEYSLNLWRINQ